MPFYAVAVGRKPGIYKTWEDCLVQTHKFSAAKYKKFNTENEAQLFITNNQPALNSKKSNGRADKFMKNRHIESNQATSQSNLIEPTDLFNVNVNKLQNDEPTKIVNYQRQSKSTSKSTNSSQPSSSLSHASSLESIIIEKTVKNKRKNRLANYLANQLQTNQQSNQLDSQLSKRTLASAISEDTIVLSDDDDSVLCSTIQRSENQLKDQSENESIILIDDDSPQTDKPSNITKRRSNIEITDKMATRSSPRKRAKVPANDENRSLEDFFNDNNNNPSTHDDKSNFNHNRYNRNNQNQYRNNDRAGLVASTGHVVIYTDGACSNNGSKNAIAGIGVWWGKDDHRNISEPLEGRATNNRAEILAAVRGINQAADLGYDSVTVCSDSDFLIKSATFWIYKWRNNKWHLSGNTGKLVKNRDDFQELINSMERIKVVWNKVKSHIGIPGNEGADQLAVEGMRKRR